jgi:HlyD family secretion protein
MAVFTLPSAVLTGMACRKAGGHIRKLGIKLWQDVIPIVYCDIGDSFEQMKNADRWVLLTIHVWWLLSVLLVSTVSWSTSVLGGTPQKLWVFLFFPCLVQLLLHLILFAKGDGYLMLCHAVGDARFHERAVNEAACWLGVGGSPEPLTSAERYWMRVYGVGNYLFRIFAEVAVFGLGGYWLMHNYGPSGAIFVLSAALWFHRDWLFAALGAVGAIAWLIRGGGNRPTQWAVRLILLAGLIAVGLLPYKHEIAGQCRIIAPEQRAVRTQIEDELVEVFVHEGDQVSPGDRIATLSGRKAHADVRIARAELEKAQATLALLEAGRRAEDLEKAEADLRYQEQRLLSQQEELARNEKLHKTNAIPAKQLDESRSRRDELQARVDSAKAKLTKMKEGFREERIAAERANVARFAEKLAYAEQQEKLLNILSPIRGQIVSPYMQQKLGQYVKPGDTIAIIQDLDTLMVEVAAADSAVAEVQPGMEVRIRLPAWNEGDLVMGQVTKVALAPQPERVSHVDAVDTQEEAFMDQSLNEQYSASTYRVRVYAELIDAPAELRPEMTGYARIVVGDDQLWRACVRPIATFLKTEVWSWLP